jgi:hypothetical protein
MNKRTISRILVAGTFFASVTIGVDAIAQTGTHPPTGATAQQAAPSKGATATKAGQNAAETNPACQRIVAECKKLGFIVGEWKEDNGLWADCFYPVIDGKNSTRKGRSINVPVSPSDLQACRAAVGQHKQSAQPTKPGAQQMKSAAQQVKQGSQQPKP